MFGILLSAFNTALGFVFRQVIVKFVVLFALYFVIQAFVSVLSGFIPTPANISSGLSGIASGSWFFMDLFGFSQGAPMIVTSLAYRFLIRRIPVIG
jgi:Protein of unknown function (DUF2523)